VAPYWASKTPDGESFWMELTIDRETKIAPDESTAIPAGL
jgi:hypothetical protein